MFSHILPTLRWTIPALCLFSCPASLMADESTQPDPPDRWAAFDANTGALRLFAFVAMFTFASELPPLDEKDLAVPQTMAEARKLTTETNELLSVLAPAFLAGADQASQRESKSRLRELLRSAPTGLYSWERAMTPDFFDWLDNG